MNLAALARIAAMLLLSAMTLALFAWDGRFQPVGSGLLTNLDFAQGGRGWTGTGGIALFPQLGPAVALSALPQRGPVYLSQDVPEPRRFEFLRLSAEVRLEGIVARGEAWQRAGITLRPFDRADQRLRYWRYEMFLGEGSGDWQRHTDVFSVSADTGRMTLFVYNAGQSGRFMVRGLGLEAVAETALARVARYTLIVCWAGLVVSTAAAMFVRTGPWSRWLLLLLGALILASTLAPQPGLVHLVGDSANRAFSVVDATVARLAPEPPAATREPTPSPQPTEGGELSMTVSPSLSVNREGTAETALPSEASSAIAASLEAAPNVAANDVAPQPLICPL